jgi:hypothetical protein
MRDIADKLNRGGFDALTRQDFNPLARACREAVAIFLNKDLKKINCTIKFCCPPDPGNKRIEVKTMGRSEHHSRPPGNENKKHYLDDNTTFCALMGVSDRVTDWKYSLPYYYRANLTKHQEWTKCSRSKFLKYYKTTMVYPLRMQDPNNGQPTIYGFLTFDSKRSMTFRLRGLVDASRFQKDPRKFDNDWTKVIKSVEYSPLINLCGAMADNITSTLYPHVQERGIR